MAKKTLEKKIADIVFWFIVFFVLYMIVVFLIDTSFLTAVNNFSFDKAHKLLNEALTLTATFLAPVAAFVLFSDWKVEHIAIKNEELSEEIKGLFNKLLPLTNLNPDLMRESMQEFSDEETNLYYISFEIQQLLNRVNPYDSESENYKVTISKAISEIQQGWQCFCQESYHKFEIQDNNPVVNEKLHKSQMEWNGKKQEHFRFFLDVYKDLKILHIK